MEGLEVPCGAKLLETLGSGKRPLGEGLCIYLALEPNTNQPIQGDLGKERGKSKKVLEDWGKWGC